jgi:hypothetical protein
MYYSSETVICKSGTSSPKFRSFTFTTTGKSNEYYISSNGKYISSVATSTLTKAAANSKSGAVKFTVGEAGDGIYYLCQTGESMKSLHCDASKNVVGWNTTADASHWKLVAVELTKELADVAALNEFISSAEEVYNMIVDTTETESIKFKDGVEVLSTTLAADVDSMMALVSESKDVIAKKYYECCPGLATSLSSAIATVKAGFTVGTGIGDTHTDIENIKIYDIRGRRVKQITESGVYIINGKKYIKQ